MNLPGSRTRDLAEQTTTLRLGVESGDADNQLELKAACTADDRSPANAVLEVQGNDRVRHAEYDAEIHSSEPARSDTEAFHHTVHVGIIRDGKAYFKRD